jgi:hypothetical protein
MKWTYREFTVEITVAYVSASQMGFTPIVIIARQGSEDTMIRLSTTEAFETVIQAELHGQRIALDWFAVYEKND